MRVMSYQELSFSIFEKFIDDIPADDLFEIINKTYTEATYNKNLSL